MTNFVYPVDTDQFQLIREQGMLYVDKTDQIFDLVNVKKYQYVFLNRPPRFGKSLLCNTFKAYFQGQKELFDGLKIMDSETEWRKYPVLHFTMSGLKNVAIPEARTKLESMMEEYETIYGHDQLSCCLGVRFQHLIHNAYKKTGEKVVVIIDEYDAPIMGMTYGSGQFDNMRTMLCDFYQVVKEEGAFLKFVFVTGVTKSSILSDINNVKKISMLDDYSGICGITQEELDTVLRPCVEEFANGLGTSIGQAYALLKKNYAGFLFSANGKEVYSPFSLLNALKDKQINYYCLESDYLQISCGFEYDGIEVGEDEFDVPCECADTPIPFLYQFGYLAIDKYDAILKTYTLHFANLEIREGIIRSLMP